MTQSLRAEAKPSLTVRIDPKLKDLVPVFLANRRKDVPAMRQALAQDDFESVRMIGHSMKGAGGGYGFPAITDFGRDIEKAAVGRDRDLIRQGVDGLADYLERVQFVVGTEASRKGEKRATILSVDDDPDTQKLVERLLRNAGYDMVPADSGAAALAMIESVKPDLILTDVMMPGMDGYAFCAQLQKDKAASCVPVIFVTSLGDEQNKARAFAAGGVDYLVKPIQLDALLGLLTTHLKTARRWKELAKEGAPRENRNLRVEFIEFREYLVGILADELNLDQLQKHKYSQVASLRIYSSFSDLGVSSRSIAQKLAVFLKVPYVSSVDSNDVQLGVLPTAFCRSSHVVAVAHAGGGRMFVLSNPFDLQLVDTLKPLRPYSMRITEPETIDALFRADPGGAGRKAGEGRPPRAADDRPATAYLDLMDRVDPGALKALGAVPVAMEGDTVVVLMESPGDARKLAETAALLGVPESRIRPQEASGEEVRRRIDDMCGVGRKPERPAAARGAAAAPATAADIFHMLESENLEAVVRTEARDEEVREDNSGIVRLVNKVVSDAHRMGASDIHIEPYPDEDLEIRLRVDGVCREYLLDGRRIPRKFSRAFVSRIKIMAQLDIAEKRLPQDGKIKFRNYGPLDIELRVATIPTAQGMEDVVIRLLAAAKPLPLGLIGMSASVLGPFQKLLQAPYGLVLCVGPTGSGKTTTLHSALGHINTADLKILTAEDPVEITQRRLRQVQVLPKIGFTFERALRAFLRADPDVIMVGEMRDLETAQAAIEASLTGHLVLSTLHTNSAPETVTRLLDMGIDPFTFGDSLLGVIAQRLSRCLCAACKEKYMPSADEWASLIAAYGGEAEWKRHRLPEAPVELFRPRGCEACRSGGYTGRIGVHEMMAMNGDLRGFVYKKANVARMREAAVQGGMVPLLQDGIQKVLKGLTTLGEIQMVCS